MRDELRGSVSNNECLILDIDDNIGDGTHWTCLFSKNGNCLYFDNFGFPPSKNVLDYCKAINRICNSFKIQAPDEVICGHYCIFVPYKFNNGSLSSDVLNELY